MDTARKRKASKLAGGVLAGGLVAGMLMAAAVPTTMKRQAENWRDLIGVPDASAETSLAITFEAPPQDLSPYWQTAQEEYPAYQFAGYGDPNEIDIDDSFDPYEPIESSEPLPTEIAAARDDVARASSVVADAADSMAEAAHEAAMAVRAAQGAVTLPDQSDAAEPVAQAVVAESI